MTAAEPPTGNGRLATQDQHGTAPSDPTPSHPAPRGKRAEEENSRWLRRLGGYVLRHRRELLIAFGAAVLGSACQTVVPLLERQIVDGVILSGSASLWPWLVALLVLSAAAFLFAYQRRYRGGRVALAVQYDLRNDIQAHLQRLDFAALDRMPTGQVVSRATSDSALVQGLLSLLPIMSGNILLVLLSLGVMLVLSPVLALVSLVVVPGLLAVSYRMRRRIFPATWDAQQREGDVVQIVDEDVNGVRVVKAFGQEGRELTRLADTAGDLYGRQLRAVRLQSRYQPLLQAIPALGQVAILVLGGWLALHHGLSLGTFLAFSTYVGQLMAPARQLAGVLAIGQQARAGVERIFQLLDLEPAIADAPDAVDLPPARGELTFKDVHFGYSADAPLLRGFDLQIAAGERVALIGPSGSGKTTATTLVSRFHDPDCGAVLLDGHDLRTVRLRSLRSQVGVVFEESFLFSDTIRANIAYGRPGATDEEILAAAKVAEADGFIRALPQGYETVVGERGLSLSGGQRQRIALARAILTDPRVLVLDDATSAVDANTEESINASLREVLAGRTTLLVAHRRSTLHLADRVVVLDGGVVADQGTHEELLERSALYRTLLTGLEEEAAERVGDRIEALTETGTTASAWRGEQGDGHRNRQRFATRAPGLGGGLGGSGGGSWRAALPPTPQLLARVDELKPVRDFAKVDLAAESRQDRSFSLGTLLREFRRPLLFGLLLVVIDAVASVIGPVFVKSGVDDGVLRGSQAVLFGAAGLFLLITLVAFLDEMAQTFVTGRTAQRVMLSLRIRIWAQLQRLSLDYYEREMAGRIMTRMTTDVDQFESLIQNGLLSALVAFVTFAGVGVTLVVVNPLLGLCTLTVVVPLAIGTVIFRRRAAKLYDVARDRVAIVNADFQESLSGVRESQAFAHEGETIRRFRRLGRDYLDARYSAQRLAATYFPFVQFLSAGADAIVLGVGAGMIHTGRLTPGALIAFILYIDLFFSPIQQLSQVFDSWLQTRVSVSRIADLMRLETLTPPAADPVDPGRLRGEVAFTGVRFAYPAPPRPLAERRGPADPRLVAGSQVAVKPPEALREIDLTIAAGETVALVGETGAGKSTVLKLLARFYDPDHGSVRVDGLDLRTLDLAAYRRALGYVPQEAFLFTGTVRDNIAYGRADATDAEVEAAARAVGAHEFVAALPGGYLHEIAERGRSLSAGQRQLLALARAQLVDPAILLLDEATSNLDLAAEAHVADAMRTLSRGRTTIVIAHRLQTAQTADRIVVLDRGRIAEIGSHDELLTRGGRYAGMWEAFELLSGQRS
ncbi:ABC transporter ATP-binding protein [Amycolatopsis sp. FDAARGOS 1241]|uniref:ABC transporter ATP-binding protein n=1 Tax=Amycolatopsis sp. FDAARGOS 1241 TaxID=2778070 RepID=UPI00194FCE01|nr:ABC transporter ATP-binding protein [Amycolatopsis sp. FDAARGOS 1241]QRP43417.1 ABC transporter ATP-binding protein [Amycolatopsis sp. FDAARGOS 1241]